MIQAGVLSSLQLSYGCSLDHAEGQIPNFRVFNETYMGLGKNLGEY